MQRLIFLWRFAEYRDETRLNVEWVTPNNNMCYVCACHVGRLSSWKMDHHSGVTIDHVYVEAQTQNFSDTDDTQ